MRLCGQDRLWQVDDFAPRQFGFELLGFRVSGLGFGFQKRAQELSDSRYIPQVWAVGFPALVIPVRILQGVGLEACTNVLPNVITPPYVIVPL